MPNRPRGLRIETGVEKNDGIVQTSATSHSLAAFVRWARSSRLSASFSSSSKLPSPISIRSQTKRARARFAELRPSNAVLNLTREFDERRPHVVSAVLAFVRFNEECLLSSNNFTILLILASMLSVVTVPPPENLPKMCYNCQYNC